MATITATYDHYFVSTSGYIWPIENVLILLKIYFQLGFISYYFIHIHVSFHFHFFSSFFPRDTTKCKCIPGGFKFRYCVYILIIKKPLENHKSVDFF